MVFKAITNLMLVDAQKKSGKYRPPLHSAKTAQAQAFLAIFGSANAGVILISLSPMITFLKRFQQV
ncbi:hypothetical protein ACWYVZ_07700 [Pediococcus acidilactici]